MLLLNLRLVRVQKECLIPWLLQYGLRPELRKQIQAEDLEFLMKRLSLSTSSDVIKADMVSFSDYFVVVNRIRNK